MRLRGINYDVGIDLHEGYLSRSDFDPDTVRRELSIIRDDLHCNAVRVSGTDLDRLTETTRVALALGLEVWVSPQWHDRSPAETRAHIVDCATRMERLRTVEARLVFVVGSELSWFMNGILPGDNFIDRLSRPLSVIRLRYLGTHNAPLNRFLAETCIAVRQEFRGPLSYASAPIEKVDWTPFDYVGLDYYRAAGNYDSYGQRLIRHFSHGKSVVLTEVGLATYRGAEHAGPLAFKIVEPKDPRRLEDPQRLNGEYVRDEELQARELIDMIGIVDDAGVDGTFVYTFSAEYLPRHEEPIEDLDMASYAVVASLADGRGAAYPDLPWEPKRSFYALAEYYGNISRNGSRLPRST